MMTDVRADACMFLGGLPGLQMLFLDLVVKNRKVVTWIRRKTCPDQYRDELSRASNSNRYFANSQCLHPGYALMIIKTPICLHQLLVW